MNRNQEKAEIEEERGEGRGGREVKEKKEQEQNLGKTQISNDWEQVTSNNLLAAVQIALCPSTPLKACNAYVPCVRSFSEIKRLSYKSKQA